jgi:hypothetical protein
VSGPLGVSAAVTEYDSPVSLFTRALLSVHLVFALSAVALFWVTALAFKGGALHRAMGRRFSRLIYAAAGTGAMLAILGLAEPRVLAPLDPIGATRQKMTLTLYLLIVMVAPVQHGLAVIAAGPVPLRVRSRVHALLSTAGLIGTVVVFPLSVGWHFWGLLLVSPLGFIIGLRNMVYASRPVASQAEWQREHLTSLLTTGIVFHTAFFVLTAARGPDVLGSGLWSAAPWLAPSAIGVPVMLYLRRTRVP